MQTYESVLARIEAGLSQGRWSLGDRLPSERALSEEFAVSRASVREALRVLEAMGIIRRSTGSGPDAGAILIDKPAAGLGAALRLHMASGATNVRDVVELRLLVENWAAAAVAQRCAAQQADEPDCLSKARELLDEMAAPDLNLAQFQELDAQFHVEIVALAGNPLIEATMLAIRTSIQEYVRTGMDRIDNPHEYVAVLHEQHHEILEVLAAGDSVKASERVCAHIEGFYQQALA